MDWLRPVTQGRRFVSVVLLALAASGCDDPAPPTPSADSATAASSASAKSSAEASSSSSAKPVASTDPVDSNGSAADPSAPSLLTAKGLEIDEKSAPNGVLPPGAADKIIKASEPPKVVLLDAGQDPKSQLVYDVKPKSKQRSTMKMDMTMSMSMAGQPPSAPGGMALPQIEIPMDLAAGDAKTDKGEIPIVVTVADVKVNPKSEQEKQMAKMMGPQLGAMKGLKIKSLIDPKGRAHDVSVEVGKDSTPEAKQMIDQMKQSMEQMVAPLPDGDVGIGAKWQVITRVSGGADILQWTTYTLVKREDSKIELEGVVRQVAASGSLSGAGMPAGMAAEIKSFRSNGTGKTKLDLGSLAPESGIGDVTSSLSVAGGKNSMQVDTSVKITFVGKK